MPPQIAILIRPAHPTDAPDLRAILHDTYETTWLPQMTADAARAYREQDRPAAYVADRLAEFWVAERDGAVVGFVDWEAGFVNALHVHSAHARQGVGGQLMDRAERAIAEAGFPAARLETDTFNERSRAFYTGRGYREADRYPDEEWNSGFTTLLVVKPLG